MITIDEIKKLIRDLDDAMSPREAQKAHVNMAASFRGVAELAIQQAWEIEVAILCLKQIAEQEIAQSNTLAVGIARQGMAAINSIKEMI